MVSVDLRTDTKNTCLKEIGLHAQELLTILGSNVNIIGEGGLYDHLIRLRIFFIQAQKIVRKMPTDTIWNQQSSCMKCVLHTSSYKKWVKSQKCPLCLDWQLDLRDAYSWTLNKKLMQIAFH